jgi:ribosomal protein L11 methyltransferase
LRAPAEAAEQVLAALLELAPSGVEQVDGDGWVEYALYGAPGELPAFPEGEAEVGGVVVRVRGEQVRDDWGERWKEFHEPVLVERPPSGERPPATAERPPSRERPPATVERPPSGERPPATAERQLWIRPPWAASRTGALDLVIDPGQAFGTGAHPTTKLSLQLMLELDPGGSFADLGCGSGVLAIAAAKLGFAPVVAVDSERAAAEATLANAAANGVALDRVERLDLREQDPPAARTVAANLVRPLLLALAGRVEGDVLILSGLLDHELDEVAAAFGKREEGRLTEQGWAAVLLR